MFGRRRARLAVLSAWSLPDRYVVVRECSRCMLYRRAMDPRLIHLNRMPIPCGYSYKFTTVAKALQGW